MTKAMAVRVIKRLGAIMTEARAANDFEAVRDLCLAQLAVDFFASENANKMMDETEEASRGE